MLHPGGMPRFFLGSYRQNAIASFAQINRVGEALRPHLLQGASVDCKEGRVRLQREPAAQIRVRLPLTATMLQQGCNRH